ncbi:hypothetical protein F3Y22_tig00002793pilonHSYRG00132 [Hibiscus syriacus]|uniref:Uncharacterized protein n=1 Tax=Hibiscus syriacus TaxID=106335 RepID=A0A6A3CQ34_HIBSY|nr:hypothetical protein F3Y22_tig00002793pilonHSYRG00132 [Hibiscus syriacus]
MNWSSSSVDEYTESLAAYTESLVMSQPDRIHLIQLPQIGNVDVEHLIPGFVNPVPSRVLPSFLFNKDGGYTAFLHIAERFRHVNGIIINTFEELEPYAVDCFYNGQYPRIYPVGPVIHLNSLPHPELDHEGSHGPPQVKEIALGLEQSGYRFLWSLHMPPQQALPFFTKIQRKCCRRVPGKDPREGDDMRMGTTAKCIYDEGTWMAVEMKLDYRMGTSEIVTADEIEERRTTGHG